MYSCILTCDRRWQKRAWHAGGVHVYANSAVRHYREDTSQTCRLDSTQYAKSWVLHPISTHGDLLIQKGTRTLSRNCYRPWM